MLTRDIVGGAAALAIGAGYLAMAVNLPSSALDDAVGTGGLPKALGALMIGLGLCLLVNGLVAQRRAAASAQAVLEADDDEVERLGGAGLARAGGLLAIAVAYVLIVRVVGYLPAIAALIVAAALHGGARLGWRVLAIGAAGAVVYHAIFVLLLGIPQPAGFLFSLF